MKRCLLSARFLRALSRSCALLVALAAISGTGAVRAADFTNGYEGFDPAATSPAVIHSDPFATAEIVSGFYGGNGSGIVPGPFIGTNINSLVGADTFYNQGYTGTNAVIANIESGHIWTGHETLGHALQLPNHSQALNEVDRHATLVSMILGGRPGGANPGDYQRGMAPDAQLYSGALGSQWGGTRYTLSSNLFFATLWDQYRCAFNTGVDASGRRADVINSSWSTGGDVTGTGTIALGLDGLANENPRTLFCVAGGNSGPGPNHVPSPATGYNNMSVAALGPAPTYDAPSSFSSGGPNDYSDPVNGTVANARQAVDIAAPGQQFGLAWYGGETGGNGTTDNPSVAGTGPTGPPTGPSGGPDYYSRSVSGTSTAAPTVAGGAALLYDAAYAALPANPDARDARVVKAVLMTSADKTAGWDNGQVPHPNGQGGVRTTQGLDNRVGTGRMNLDAAYVQFLTGTTDVSGTFSGLQGIVNPVGWDFGEVISGTLNDYLIDVPLLGGSTFTATLTWFRDRRIDSADTVYDDSFDNLDLELWSVIGTVPTTLVSESISLYNESEHFSFAIPGTGSYGLRVRWSGETFDVVGDADRETYGLAWSGVAVPEPSSLVLTACGSLIMLCTARRRLGRQAGR